MAATMPAGCGDRPQIAAVQSFYREGVPHTDRQGRLRETYDSRRSFLPLGLYHALSGEHHGVRYRLDAVTAAGFNTVHPWEGQDTNAFVKAARAAGLQTIVHWPDDETVRTLSDRPGVLAWYLDEEPSPLYPVAETDARLAAFEMRRRAIGLIDRTRPVIVIDGPPKNKRLSEWRRWNAAGDVTAHFNYPVTVAKRRSYGPVERVAETTVMARRLVDGAKPLWMVLQAFGGEARGWHMPSPATLRAMAYAAVVHGATGLIYFAFDSFVTRDDGVLGISPTPVGDYGVERDYNTDGKPALVVSELDMARSRALYRAVAELNAELTQLREAILSPSSSLSYSVKPAGDNGRDGAVRALLKPYRDAHILITVNVDAASRSVGMRFARPVESVTPLFASPPPTATVGNGWTDRFQPEQVKVYRIVFAKR